MEYGCGDRALDTLNHGLWVVVLGGSEGRPVGGFSRLGRIQERQDAIAFVLDRMARLGARIVDHGSPWKGRLLLVRVGRFKVADRRGWMMWTGDCHVVLGTLEKENLPMQDRDRVCQP